MDEKNPLGLKLEKEQERTTGNVDYEIIEKDGGAIRCPLAGLKYGGDPNCNSNCAWFTTICDIPGKLGLVLE